MHKKINDKIRKEKICCIFKYRKKLLIRSIFYNKLEKLLKKS